MAVGWVDRVVGGRKIPAGVVVTIGVVCLRKEVTVNDIVEVGGRTGCAVIVVVVVGALAVVECWELVAVTKEGGSDI